MSFLTHWTKRIWKRDSSHAFWIWNEASIQPRPWNAMKFRQKSVVLGQCQAQAENSVATHFSSPLSSHEQAARLKWKCYVSGTLHKGLHFGSKKWLHLLFCVHLVLSDYSTGLWIAVNGALSSLTFFAPGFSSGTKGPASTTTSSACRARHFNQSKWH